MTYLEHITEPADIKNMNTDELKLVAEQIRQAILKRGSQIGGHIGSNLGVVELTIALHYVFNSPIDKIIFDVSHQSYPHKILTGRQNGFLNPEDYNKISGFTNPDESRHDQFFVGHTSTSISLASGFAKARDLNGEKYNVVAVIGDGSLSGGEAFEGLNFAGSELNSNLIVVVNDNGMSMVENHGALYNNLKLLRETDGKAELNYFKSLGFDYMYVANGHDIDELITAFNQVKDSTKPIVVHVKTIKGKGYKLAEEQQEIWHKRAPFDISTGDIKKEVSTNYVDITCDYLADCVANDEPIAIITAGTASSYGFSKEIREEFGLRYIDVGIAEEHAVAMASAMAKGGVKPVLCMHSTFLQRAYDQISQDLALNKSPALILVYYGGISGEDATHLGIFDIPMLTNIPNITYLSPSTYEEYISMLDWALKEKNETVVLRIPSGTPIITGEACEDDFNDIHFSKIIEEGEKVAIITEGCAIDLACETTCLLKKQGINPTLISARYLDETDDALLGALYYKHNIVVTLENGSLSGGFGEKVARYFGKDEMRVLCYGATKEFTNRVPVQELYKKYRMTPEMIVEDINDILHPAESKFLKQIS